MIPFPDTLKHDVKPWDFWYRHNSCIQDYVELHEDRHSKEFIQEVLNLRNKIDRNGNLARAMYNNLEIVKNYPDGKISNPFGINCSEASIPQAGINFATKENLSEPHLIQWYKGLPESWKSKFTLNEIETKCHPGFLISISKPERFSSSSDYFNYVQQWDPAGENNSSHTNSLSRCVFFFLDERIGHGVSEPVKLLVSPLKRTFNLIQAMKYNEEYMENNKNYQSTNPFVENLCSISTNNVDAPTQSSISFDELCNSKHSFLQSFANDLHKLAQENISEPNITHFFGSGYGECMTDGAVRFRTLESGDIEVTSICGTVKNIPLNTIKRLSQNDLQKITGLSALLISHSPDPNEKHSPIEKYCP